MKPSAFYANTVPIQDYRSVLARHKAWLPVRALLRGSIVKTTPWASTLKVARCPIQQVSNFTYLGAVISGDGTIDEELSSRIQRALGAFYTTSLAVYQNTNES